MSARAAPLRRRLMLAFGSFTVLVAGLFGAYALVFMYAVEDSLLESTLAQEAEAMQRHRALTGRWGTPRESYVALHLRPADFPEDLRQAFAAEPRRREFAGGDGRHYHLLALPDSAGEPAAWLVAEVSGQLVVRPMRSRILGLLAGSALALVLLALAVATWLAGRTAGPLARLAAVVETMDPADLPRALGRGFRNDEVGVLARGLESLTERLRDFIAREREFTCDVSHELRTPLTVIRSASERLLARPGLDADMRTTSLQVQRSALQLQQTVDLLLSLAREGAAVAPSAPTRVLPVLERVIVDQSPLAEGRTLDFDIRVPEAATAGWPEPVLHTLLSNLVGNAMAHGAGTVRIVVQGGGLSITNAVRPDDAGSLAQRRDGSPGLGLGLGIVRRLCERHGIALEVAREGDRVRAGFPLHGATSGPPSRT